MAIATVVIVGTVAMDRVVLTPWWRHLSGTVRQMQELEESLASQRRLVELKESVAAELERMKPYLQPGAATELQMGTLFKEVEQMAKHSQASLVAVKPLPVTEAERLQTYALEVQCECLLPQWIRFVYLIEASPTLFEIERATLEAQEGKPGQLRGLLRLTASVMREPPPVLIGGDTRAEQLAASGFEPPTNGL